DVGPHRDVLTRPPRPGQFPPRQFGSVDLHDDLGVEVEPGVKFEVGVGVPGEAVDAGVAAAPVWIDGELERHPRRWRHLVDNRLGVYLVKRHAAEAGSVEGPRDDIPAEEGRLRIEPWLLSRSRLACSGRLVDQLSVPTHTCTLEHMFESSKKAIAVAS